MSRICLYFKQEPERDRWVPGDRLVRPFIRHVIRGKPKFVSGVDRIFLNLRDGLDRLGVKYEVNLPFSRLQAGDRVGAMGRGVFVLQSYTASNPIVAGPYLMTYPAEHPNLCQEYPIAKYLQHCDWANEIYKPFYGDRCTVWAHGVDVQKWAPTAQAKDVDVLIYDKIRWDRETMEPKLLQPILALLQQRGLRVAVIRYGAYTEKDYRDLLARSRSMIFLVEHESQGSACQECLATDVPILAWDQGWCKDPSHFKRGLPNMPVSSVPYFDDRCGVTFKDQDDFAACFDLFWERLAGGKLSPRAFVLERLTLEKCAQRYLQILEEAQT